ncbi:hypothetical protein [Roseibium album]|uniref:hypothetical protein n=1 Tax=Roseibium album TaxID=311410 RepID=UPI002491B979|nr:hypothetical protein [Roseibium album]
MIQREQLERLSGRLASRLLATVRKDDVVVELDAGLGTITTLLARLTRKAVHAVEDTALCEALLEETAADPELVHVTCHRKLTDLASLTGVDVVVLKGTDPHSDIMAPLCQVQVLGGMPWIKGVRYILMAGAPCSVALVDETAANPSGWLGKNALADLQTTALLASVFAGPQRRPITSAQLLSGPAPIDWMPPDGPSVVAGWQSTVNLTAVKSGTVGGLALFPDVGRADAVDPFILQASQPICLEDGSVVPLHCDFDYSAVRPLINIEAPLQKTRFLIDCNDPCRASRPQDGSSPEANAAPWSPRYLRLRVMQAALEAVHAGATRTDIIDIVSRRLGVRSANDRRLIKQLCRAMLTRDLIVETPTPQCKTSESARRGAPAQPSEATKSNGNVYAT